MNIAFIQAVNCDGERKWLREKKEVLLSQHQTYSRLNGIECSLLLVPRFPLPKDIKQEGEILTKRENISLGNYTIVDQLNQYMFSRSFHVHPRFGFKRCKQKRKHCHYSIKSDEIILDLVTCLL